MSRRRGVEKNICRGGIRLAALAAPPLFCLCLAPLGLAHAACTTTAPTTGTTVTCSGTGIAPVIAATGSGNVVINIVTGVNFTSTRTASSVSFSVDHASQITNNGALTLTGGGGTGTNRGAVLLGVADGNTLTNASGASLTTTGAYNDGMAASGNGNTLINNGSISTAGPNAYGMTAAWGQTQLGQINNSLINNGTVSTTGSNARALSILGQNGTSTNTGSLLTTGTASHGVYMQGNNDTLVNSGTIQVQGSGADAVFSNTVSTSFTANIRNLPGGRIISQQGAAIRAVNGSTTVVNAGLLQGGGGTAVQMGMGSNVLILQTGSAIVGAADGGGGTNKNTLILQGSGSATNVFTRFNTLLAQGTDWSWSGSGAFDSALVQGGAFHLTGTVSGTGAAPGSLTFDHATATGVAGFTHWNTVNVTNGTQLAMDGTLMVGTPATGTGTVTIDASSTLLAGNGANGSIAPLTSGRLAQVNNAGTIDLTNGDPPAANTFTIVGNYAGQQANVVMGTVLGADGSPSDKLVISGGNASGSTLLHVTNLGGAGGLTVQNGILLVEATQGATMAATAFSLNGGKLQAGAYTYLLFEGGVTPGTSQNWYLRSTLPPAPPIVSVLPTGTPTSPTSPSPATPQPPTTPGGESAVTEPIAAEGSPLLPPPPAPGDPPTPLYRPEVALDSVIPAVNVQVGLLQLGTYDQRQGGQLLATGNGWVPAGWVRVLGYSDHQQQGGAGAQPQFDGHMDGAQVGHDIYARESDSGQRDRIGFFIGYLHTSGDVSGSVVGFPDARAGTLRGHADSAGAYWTHLFPSDAYVDAVLLGTWSHTEVNSIQGFDNRTHGTTVAASLETGLPLRLTDYLTLEPQAQVIMQHLTTDGFTDPVSTVSFEPTNAVTGRIGARLVGDFHDAKQIWQPYLKLDLWRNFHRDYNTVFGGVDDIPTNLASTALEAGGGVSARLSEHLSLYGEASYLRNTDAWHRRGTQGDIGLHVRW
ncbi:autotransporter outer membrane beta-barrel domain-containing protein [Dyella silvae]|uniref:autotransporter family protein n=1 Tax=Dyella silvae TaxID=2994424 RepID=UPI002263D915|nr:autotransporter outer membrane beta-barrel domain-containing protein [Dyella silvae]